MRTEISITLKPADRRRLKALARDRNASHNVLDGTVIGRNMQRHRHQEFIRFLNAVEAQVPARKEIHAIVDNYATHKHPKVRQWLARHPRWSFHFTPTSWPAPGRKLPGVFLFLLWPGGMATLRVAPLPARPPGSIRAQIGQYLGPKP